MPVVEKGGGDAPVPICAIGASAGGVQALREFFRHVPDDLGLAYVVIIHLAPDHPSSLSEILSLVTKMDVLQVHDSPELKPNCVYVIAPDRELVIDDKSVASRPFSDPRGQRAPIDMFFRSVAAARGDGLAVVLSGAGSDGAAGVQAIKEAGGVVFVQEPSDAEYPMMPRSALSSGAADFVAPIPRLVERIVEVVRSKGAVRSLSEEAADHHLQRIIAFLRARTGHDFASYKRATVLRRVARRMQVARSASLSDYAAYMVANPEEAQELFGDLLISVTAFFRDPGAYEALEREGIGTLFDNATEEGLRAWVVGCATGEEAYSLAILLLEEAARRRVTIPIQIFATDLDEGALATAREGRFPSGIEADLGEERLARWFVKEGLHYRVKKEVRDIVLFASHSVIKDPPFMRLDLVSCRNLLIYMERQLQREVCALFAYGLRPQGLLFLGSAETTDATPDLFAPLDREARLYRARDRASQRMPLVARMPSEHRPAAMKRAHPDRSDERERSSGALHVHALERAAPPSVLVDRSYHALHLSAQAGRFLLPSGGPVSNDVADMVRPELRLDLRGALRRAFDKAEATVTMPIPTSFDGERRRVIMQVAPVMEPDAGPPAHALVVFLDGGPATAREAASDGPSRTDVERLRGELEASESRLMASRAEHETAIQNLRVANEELQSINEEYRATSEELETSKEELQSMNEELQTVNAELKSKLESIGAAHSDLENIVAATDIGTLFLDHKLRIRMFTPRVAELFNVTHADVGRPITDFTHRLDYQNLAEDAAEVLRDLIPVEREVQSIDGRWLMVRVRPYRTLDDRIEGCVVTFVNVSAQREATARLRESEERYRTLFEAMDEAYAVVELVAGECGRWTDFLFVEVNPAFMKHTSMPYPVGKTATELLGTPNPRWVEIYGRVIDTGDAVRLEEDPVLDRVFDLNIFRLGDAGSRRVAVLFTDVTERRRNETALRDSEERFRALVSATSDVIYRMSPDWREMRELSGRGFLAEAARPDADWQEGYILPEDRDFVQARIDEAIRLKVPFELEHRVFRADGAVGWAQTRAIPMLDERGEILEWFGATSDVTERRLGEERLREARDALALATSASQLGWGAWDFGADEAGWDARGREIIGLREDETTIRSWMERVHPEDREALEREIEACVREARPFDLEYRVVHRDGTVRVVHGTGMFERRPASGGAQGTGLVRDVTELRRWEEAQRLLVGELNHRVKNMLAIVQSTARQTQRTTSSVEAFNEAFEQRIHAIAGAHGILTRRNWSGAELGELAREALSSFSGDGDSQVRIEGPEVDLRPDATISFAMALHELATNALKHGALSRPEGRVDVRWRLEAGDRVFFEWVESGGPEVTPPARRGFGSRLLERGIAVELDGDVRLEFLRDGLHCTMEFLIDGVVGSDGAAPPGGGG